MNNDQRANSEKNNSVTNKMFTGHIKKPGNLIFEEKDDEIRLILDGDKVISENMQVPANAFEGWVAATRACTLDLKLDLKVVLDVTPQVHYNFEETQGQGHLARFLYRAAKFDDQYDWFELSETLSQETNKFKKFLESGTFTNNIPSGIAGNTDRVEDENTIEEALSKGKVLKGVLDQSIDIGDNQVYRQLPVGLFKNEVSRESAIFTGGKSAIDLWTYNGTELSVIELKFKNKMIGTITEIFFYANYMYDLVTKNDWFIFNASTGKSAARGYEKLTIADLYESVNGIMLADKETGFHPLINDATLKVLKDSNNKNIRYYMDTYEYKCEVWHG